MAEIAVTVQASGEAYVALVVGAAPEVRESVALDALGAADAIPALDGLVLDFDHYGRVVGLRITGAVDSILAPSLLEVAVPASGVSLTEFPADDPERARRFWAGFLGVEMEARRAGEGEGWQAHSGAPEVGHARGRGPGDSFSLPYFAVSDVADAQSRSRRWAGPWFTRGRHGRLARTLRRSPFRLARQGVGG